VPRNKGVPLGEPKCIVYIEFERVSVQVMLVLRQSIPKSINKIDINLLIFCFITHTTTSLDPYGHLQVVTQMCKHIFWLFFTKMDLY
jgi:hypothetical protein